MSANELTNTSDKAFILRSKYFFYRKNKFFDLIQTRGNLYISSFHMNASDIKIVVY